MSALLLLFGIVLFGITVRVLIYAAVLPRLQLSAHLRSIETYGFEQVVAVVDEEPETSRLDQALKRLASRAGTWAMAKVPALKPLDKGALAAAGMYDSVPEIVHGYRVLAMVLLPVLFGWFLLLALGGVSMIVMLLIVASAAAGWFLPGVVINSKGVKRLDELDRDLPELIDVLIATVEAGMGVGGSISLVAERFDGPLGDELRLTLKQQQLGISNQEAFTDMAERCNTPSMRAFVRTVTRGEALGGSIGTILRELAQDQRRRRRQAAEERMQKAPVKMLFPLMFLIFPALMLELMYPAAYTLIHNMSGF